MSEQERGQRESVWHAYKFVLAFSLHFSLFWNIYSFVTLSAVERPIVHLAICSLGDLPHL